MSLATTSVRPLPHTRTETRVLLTIIWAATVLSYLVAGHGGELSTDDAMRLVQVRDLLAGQSWFDLTQYRLNPPEGVLSHWSRLIDLPIALLIRAGELVLPAARAEQVALLVWPAGLLLLFLAGIVRLARGLADDTAACLALIFAALMAPVLQHFRPGAIDHHNAQLVLLVWSVALVLRPVPRMAALAGVACGLSVAIGAEMIPAIAVLSAFVGIRWIVCGDAARPAAMAFGLTFAGSTALAMAATVPPSSYGLAACDALSIVQVTAVGIGGIGLACLAALPGLTTPGRRLFGAAMLGALLAGTIMLAFPGCLGDPYGHLDPRLATLWLNHVSESRSVFAMWRDVPQEVVPYYGLATGGLAAGVLASLHARDDARWRWIAATAVLAVLLAISLWQVRGAAGAGAIAVALLPAALVRAFPAHDRAVFFGLGRNALLVAALVNPLSLIGFGAGAARAYAAVTGTPQPTIIADGAGTCRRASDYAPLARLPRGLIVGFIDAGPFILMETPHAALAAPYHRNLKGNAAMFDLLLAPPQDAVARLAERGALLAFCRGSPERHTYAAAAPDSLVAALGRGDVLDSLERVPLNGTDLEIYRAR